jgi:hypothetical protein
MNIRPGEETKRSSPLSDTLFRGLGLCPDDSVLFAAFPSPLTSTR